MLAVKVNKRLVAQLILTLLILIIIVDAVRKAVQSSNHDESAPVIPKSFESAMVFQDFENDLTALVDEKTRQCFIAPLEKYLPQHDEDLNVLLDKMQRGEYNPNQETIHQSYKVISPPVDDLRKFGVHVESACANLKAYKLSKIEGVVQGSHCDSVGTTWNTGSKLVNAHIFYCR